LQGLHLQWNMIPIFWWPDVLDRTQITSLALTDQQAHVTFSCSSRQSERYQVKSTAKQLPILSSTEIIFKLLRSCHFLLNSWNPAGPHCISLIEPKVPSKQKNLIMWDFRFLRRLYNDDYCMLCYEAL
jgi:hypothetical protein